MQPDQVAQSGWQVVDVGRGHRNDVLCREQSRVEDDVRQIWIRGEQFLYLVGRQEVLPPRV